MMTMIGTEEVVGSAGDSFGVSTPSNVTGLVWASPLSRPEMHEPGSGLRVAHLCRLCSGLGLCHEVLMVRWETTTTCLCRRGCP